MKQITYYNNDHVADSIVTILEEKYHRHICKYILVCTTLSPIQLLVYMIMILCNLCFIDISPIKHFLKRNSPFYCTVDEGILYNGNGVCLRVCVCRGINSDAHDRTCLCALQLYRKRRLWSNLTCVKINPIFWFSCPIKQTA